jgi:hypothetical protein
MSLIDRLGFDFGLPVPKALWEPDESGQSQKAPNGLYDLFIKMPKLFENDVVAWVTSQFEGFDYSSDDQTYIVESIEFLETTENQDSMMRMRVRIVENTEGGVTNKAALSLSGFVIIIAGIIGAFLVGSLFLYRVERVVEVGGGNVLIAGLGVTGLIVWKGGI